MPNDPIRIADTRAWLSRARNDLQAAERLASGQPPLLDSALFHCQQAVEKSLKAFLTWQDQRFRRTHDLNELGSAVSKIEGTLTELLRRSAPLTEYAWKFRYPGESSEPTSEETSKALSLARELYDAFLQHLPEEVHP